MPADSSKHGEIYKSEEILEEATVCDLLLTPELPNNSVYVPFEQSNL